MPRSKALERMRGGGIDGMMKNPMSGPQGVDGLEFFVNKDMLPDGCQEGDTVKVVGTVGKIGSKVAITPMGIEPESGVEGEPEEEPVVGPADNAQEATVSSD